MCVNDAEYYAAKKKYEEADEEIKRCEEAISYFEGWLPQISGCIGCLDQLISQTKAIGAQCEEIIINGKPIDQGKRHYPNGGAYTQAISLGIVKSALDRLKQRIDKSITDLQTSKENATKDKEAARIVMINKPTNCGYCIECNPSAYVVTTGSGTVRVTSTSGCGSSRTTSTTSSRTTSTSGCTSTRTSSSNSTSTSRGRSTHNRAVMVALE